MNPVLMSLAAALPKFTWDIEPTIFKYPDWMSFMPGDGIRYYSLLYVGVFLGGYKLLDWQIRRAGGSEEDASDFVLYGVIAVLGGARMGHVFFYEFDRFLEDPLWLFQIWKGGLSSHGGTLGLMLAMWLFTKVRRQSYVEGSDRFAFSAALGATLIRIGNFFNSEIVGRPTDQSWGVKFARYDDVYRHPSQLYEVALGLFVMASLWLTDKLAGKERRPRGLMISMFFALYFTGRFIVEYFKEYQVEELVQVREGLTRGQELSIPLAILGFIGVAISLKKAVPAQWNVYRISQDEEEDEDDDEYADEEYDEYDEDDDVDPDVDEVLAQRHRTGRPAALADEDDEADDDEEAEPDDKASKKDS